MRQRLSLRLSLEGLGMLLNQSINQSINQSCVFRVVQVIKSLQDPLEVGNNLPGINDNVREWGLEQNRDGADITLSGRLFRMVGPATGKTRPQTVDSFTDSTSRWLVRAEQRERRPGRSATRTSWLRFDGHCHLLTVSTINSDLLLFITQIARKHKQVQTQM